MEKSAADEEKREMEEPLLKDSSTTKGGLKAILLILVNGFLEKVGSFGLIPNMTLYLTSNYHLELIKVSNIIMIWLASINITPVIGAVLADGYFGRYSTIGFGSVLSTLGMVLLWSTTMFPGLRPPTCSETSNNCNSTTTTFQLLFLFTSFALLAIGGGGIRSSSLAFGVDQFVKKSDVQKGGLMDKFFSWYYAMYMFSMLIGYTFIVYIQDNLGWQLGFGVSIVLLILASVFFFVGHPFYVKSNAKANLLTELVQVVVASFKRRGLVKKPTISSSSSSSYLDIMYHHKKGSNLLRPTDKLRFLNNACILEDPDKELNPDGTAKDGWSLCTVEQVEDLKALIKTIPIGISGVIAFISMSQGSFQVVQAKDTNRNIFGKFEIPAGSFATFSIFCVAIWVPFYDYIFLPLVSQIRGKPTLFNSKQRIGAGILITIVSLIVTAGVESMRLWKAPEKISALWIVPQYCLIGSAEAMITVAQGEFFVKEFPKSMWSIAASLCLVEMSIANMLASMLMSIADILTKRGGNKSWISDDINDAHFDYYFWILSGVVLLDFFFFVYSCRRYGPCKADQQLLAPATIEEDQDVVV